MFGSVFIGLRFVDLTASLMMKQVS